MPITMARAMGLFGLFLACISVQLTEGRLFRACGTPSCLCFPERAMAVCARLGSRMTHVPNFRSREVATITGVNLSRQDITRLRPSDFTRSTWPALEWIDLRGNANLDCSSLRAVPSGVKVLSDCHRATPSPPPRQLPADAAADAPARPRGKVVEDIAQSDSSVAGASSPMALASSGSGTVKNTDNKTKGGKELVIPFKGYFKLFLPKL